LISASQQPITVAISEPAIRTDYNGLMAGSAVIKPGWQAVHAVRYAYGAPAAADQAQAPWLTGEAPAPLISDTGEIVKDPARKQLTVATASAEAFSGMLDGVAPARLHALGLSGSGFATVMVVADDHQPLATSSSLVISRTATRDGDEVLAPEVHLKGLASGHWWLHITRPREVSPEQQLLTRSAAGDIILQAGAWHEAELRRTP
jgi:hypothetical protein